MIALPRVLLIEIAGLRGQQHQVVGRAAEIVALVIAYQERINASHGGRFTVNYAEGKVKPELLELLEGAG